MITGKKSTFSLTQLASKFNEIQKNGLVLSNRKAMEIIWHRVTQLAERIDMNEAPERLTRLQKLWAEFKENRAKGKSVEEIISIRDIDEEFEKAYHDYMAWQQMFEALQLHSKMQEGEVKIMKDLQAIITAEDAYELVAKVMAVLLRVLQDDPKKLKEAQYELTRITGESIDSRTGGGGYQITGEAGPGSLDGEEFLYPGNEERPDPAGPSEIGGISEGRSEGDIQSG